MVMTVFSVGSASAQLSTPPLTSEEREAMYTASVEKRTTNTLQVLALNDPAKSARVHDAIVAQYHALRERDEAMDAMLRVLSRNAPGTETNRAGLLPIVSKSLHDRFLARLSADLAPEQIEIVKDKMTYNKVQVTYDAYCAIVPGLTDEHKAKILELLKVAREEAMDGGNAGEKSDIFQKYKDRINDYLNAHGHDVAKAYKDWEAKQELAKKAKDESAAKATLTQ
jgi:hypothetical protein